ncbi:glycosyl transferase 2 family protein [Rickettsia endosymbiont of Ixodes pacificus]|uniref:glycosyltransferase family 2 protein n=1 Tax=Rickettsia endosymbiont of Ixodes pacificus TaxID=1133329 RepID=UPI0005F88306|nr:glycosyltransferase family 2 protein [Rickettsia endosymbiont of Ixodes pacificus]KJW02849.1 glycosyl transferase 2 family protein [Rickettsia endosymbiont of Ixodes pacificus]
MTKISAFIITKNEAARIAIAINSVKNIVDEVIVVDNESTDDTVSIAEKLGAKVVIKPWLGYVGQKSFAESLCVNDWVLNIDADEELSKELQDEIEYIFASKNQDQYLAYQIKLLIMHRNDQKPRMFAPFNKCTRLYNKKFASFANTVNNTTHDSVIFNKDVDFAGKIYLLNEAAYHYSGTSIEQLVTKANFYSSEQAKDLMMQDKKVSNTRIAFEMLWWFFKAFFIRRYFVFGFDGFVDSIIFAFARFLRLAKLRESLFKSKNVIASDYRHYCMDTKSSLRGAKRRGNPEK